ncbi:MAG: hypothetical protein AAF211_14490 [Myxococcota bacterium]
MPFLIAHRRGRHLTSILPEDMADTWSVPTKRDPDQVSIVIDRERPVRSTNQPALTPPNSRQRR